MKLNAEPFTLEEARELWARLVAGWANHLDASGARTLFEGVPNAADAGGSYEGVTRMLWGFGGWLSQPHRPAIVRWRGETFDIAALMRRALVAGTDPASRGYWGRGPRRGEYDQRTVESGQVAFATWQTRERIWARLRGEEQSQIVAWLDMFGQRPARWNNNWALFWCLNHAARKALGQPHEQAIIDSALDYLEAVYCGDGWYDDAAERGANYFDDYALWVFGTHVLAWAQCDGATQPGRRDMLLGRVRELLAHMPYFFAADGSYTEYGRSLSYKFARLGAPLWAYQQGCWPHSPGMLRRLIGRHVRWYIDRGALRADGTLRQSLTAEGSAEVRETYISTGATYWAMLAFGALWSLADDDPFWTAPEEPLPVEHASFVKILPQPGWILVGDQASGHVQRFSGRSAKYPAKYEKFAYTTAAPFNVGLVDGMPAPDSMLSLTDGTAYGFRTQTLAFASGEPGWMRFRHMQHVGGTHVVDTTLIVRGELHLRAHRVALDPGATAAISAVEGAAPLGYASGDMPRIESNREQRWEYAAADGRAVAIAALRGYDSQRRAATWQGRDTINSVYGHYVLPLLEVGRVEQAHDLICLVHTGAELGAPAALVSQVEEAGWDAAGAFRVRWAGGEELVVPPLAEESARRD